MLENNVLGGNNMTPEEAEKAKIRAKKEIEVFSIYLEQAIDTFGSMLGPQEVFLAAGFAYLGAGQTDIHAAIEGLYEQIQ